MPVQLYRLLSVVNLLLLPVVIINLLTVNLKIFTNFKQFVVITGSMEPVIGVGSLIYSTSQQNYKKGDIVSYLQNGKYIVHRIEKVIMLGKDIYFSTKGDNNTFSDINLVHKSEIVGKVNTIIPFVGRFIMFYKTPLGFFSTEFIVILFVCIKVFSSKKNLNLLVLNTVSKTHSNS